MTDTVTIVHAADIHLDSPLRGLERLGDGDLVQRLRKATRDAFGNLVARTIDTDADALVLAGDIYDGDWRDYATGRYFVEQMTLLDDAGIPVFLVAGNHDAASVITRSLNLPGNVHVFATDRPETVRRDDLGLAIHGQGFPERSVMSNLAVNYPEPVPGLVNVGVLHTSVAGYDDHDPYAPCTVDDLKSKGYEYFALGHVHQRQVLCEGRTTAVFSGNLQGRHVKETGPKGAMWVTLQPGMPADVEFVPLDVARWEHIVLDLGDVEDLNGVLERVSQALVEARVAAEDRPVVARLTLEGTTAAAGALADRERVANEIELIADRRQVAVERIRIRTNPPPSQIALSPEHVERLRALAAGDLFSDENVAELFRPVTSKTDPVLRPLSLLEDLDTVDLVQAAVDDLLAQFSQGTS